MTVTQNLADMIRALRLDRVQLDPDIYRTHGGWSRVSEDHARASAQTVARLLRQAGDGDWQATLHYDRGWRATLRRAPDATVERSTLINAGDVTNWRRFQTGMAVRDTNTEAVAS